MHGNGSYGFTSGLFLGATLGAVAALLLAPKSGREVRDGLYTGAERLKERASAKASEIVGRGEAAIENARQAARETADGVIRGAARLMGKGEETMEKGALPSSYSNS